MKILCKKLPSPHSRSPFCATLGVFDGVHRGHTWIIRKSIREAGTRPLCKPLVITFFPAPEYCLKKAEQFHLSELSEKVRAISALGCANVLVLRFDTELAALSGVDFFKLLLKKIRLAALFVGDDFKFGKDRRHGMEALRTLLRKQHTRLGMVKKKRLNGEIVSSSRIRKLLREGKAAQANLLLGRAYSVAGKVIRGKGIGNLIGVPTANVAVSHYKLIPKSGVYAVEVIIKNKKYQGACNIGAASALLSQSALPAVVEVHILNFRKNLRGRRIEIRFLKRIRDEKKFSSLSALCAQIEKDIKVCKRIYSANGSHVTGNR